MSLFSDWIKKVESEVESALTFAEPVAADVASAKNVVGKILAFVNAAEAATHVAEGATATLASLEKPS